LRQRYPTFSGSSQLSMVLGYMRYVRPPEAMSRIRSLIVIEFLKLWGEALDLR
jgi:hypothetical protein